MSSLLDEACVILNSLEKDIAAVKAIWNQLAADNPHFEQVDDEHWQEKHRRMWLHGAVEVNECNELERWVYGDLPTTKIALSPAKKIYKAWRKWLGTSGRPKKIEALNYDRKSGKYVPFESSEPSDAYYADDNRFDIQEPLDGESLGDFIVRLARLTEDDGKGERLEWRALKSFLDFIRKTHPTEQVAFIEHIFPQKMKLHYGRIIRLIPKEAYPIPEGTAAELLIEFARRCRTGRPDARHTAAEGLALCWLCIAASRIRLPKTLEMVEGIKASAILSGAEFSISTVPTFGSGCFTYRPIEDDDFSVLRVPTWFGEQPLKISNRIAAFLKAVSRISSKSPRETILQRPSRSLTRMFDEILKSINPNPEYGNITYLSLLQQPHIFGDHRPQPKYQ